MKIIESSDILIRHNLDTNHQLADLYRLLNEKFNCTYLTYMREDLKRNNKVYFSSNPNWQDLLIGQSLINICPIYSIAFDALNNTNIRFYPIVWNNVSHNKKQDHKDLKDLRDSHDIAHGLGFAIQPQPGIRESIVFAGSVKDVAFHLKLSNKAFVTTCVELFRYIIFNGDPENSKELTTSALKEQLLLT
ncbi:autoinducer binding domain-containing protein [Piscirickettsia salmonis]|uniref:autoinducer binding domain-containing protein n=1 Tax=Piscirickettsia salmonis TaxID=1238 RepID=UPI0006BD200E|nr:autoinducer binding domain-containing protein [Piscirickettsia salmonis]ALA26712.1 transcriptional regulator GntR [Piscirickettsia salmonis]APS45836.1 hypothetical protein AVI48_15495 [Piscirickettsia salmonis]APS49281.1 hypothetical protein AVI49_16630 [Piscirickettsia salmonis]QGO82329.1 hypothetical protein Psal107_03380 [Piscirickettsia salmonis]QGP24158.1 hypothetical protein Psal158_03332 [Piscirickettsia salmonis]